MERVSLADLFGAVLPGIREAAANEWTERDWQQSMRRASMDMAHEILKGCNNLPRLVSVTAPDNGVSAFIEMESDNALFSIVVTTTRKAEPMDPEPTKDDGKCVFCGRVHENATTETMRIKETTENRDRATADEPVKPWPAWGSNASD